MKKTYSIAFKAKYADLVLGADGLKHSQVGRTSDTAIEIKGDVGDDLYRKALEVNQTLGETGNGRLAYYCRFSRSYDKREIERSRLFVIGTRYQYGAAKEFGTWYTDEKPNPRCGIDRQQLKILQTSPYKSVIEDKPVQVCALSSRQVGPLHFPFLKFVKRDIFALWGGETIVSERLAKLIETGGFTGGKLLPIWNTRRGAQSLLDLSDCLSGRDLLARAKRFGLAPSDRLFWSWIESEEQLPQLDRALWEQKALSESLHPVSPPARTYFQLRAESLPLRVAGETAEVRDPFSTDSEHCECEFGKVERQVTYFLDVSASSWDGSDICQTDTCYGGRVGLFRPFRHLVISKRLFDAMRQQKMKGFEFEIVEMV